MRVSPRSHLGSILLTIRSAALLLFAATSAHASGKPLSISLFPQTQSITEGQSAQLYLRKSGGNGRDTPVRITTPQGVITVTPSTIFPGTPFTLPVQDDVLVNGTRTLTITGKSTTGAITTAKIYVADNDTSAPPPPLTLSVYDTSIGQSVDADGFTALPLRVGAHRYFVKPSGSDANSCSTAENAATPKATIASAAACLVDGEGDQMMLAEGATFSDPLPWFPSVKGFSSLYPTVFRSYDPADPGNAAKYGRADQRNARPKVGVTVSNGNGGTPYGYIAIQGLKFDPGNVAGAGGISVLGAIHHLLIENSIFAYTGLSIDGLAPGAGQHVIARNDAFYGEWNTDGRTGGVYAGAIDYLTVEDCVIFHAGWKIGALRDDDPTLGGTTVFSHSLYIQLDTNGTLVRRNLIADGAADGGSMRGDTSLYTENVLAHNPISTGLGGGFEYNIHRPNGVSFEASWNLTLAGNDLNSTNPRGKAFDASNGKPGSRVHHNLAIYNGVEHGTEASLIDNGAGLPQASYVDFDDNTSFHWNDPGETHTEGPLVNIAYVHASHDRNRWDDTASGTNINSGSVAFPNPYTEASLYSAAGFANYSGLIAAAIASPQNHYPRTLIALAFAGYGITAPTDVTAPTLSSPVGTATGTTTATVGATTNEGNGRLFYDVTTSSTAPHTSQIKLGLTTTGAVAPKSGAITITSAGVKSVNLSGVPPGTYYAHLYHEDASGNRSARVTSSSFVIAGAPSATWEATTDWTRTNGNLTAEHTGATGANQIIRTTSAQTNWATVLFTIVAQSEVGMRSIIGFDTGAETNYPGADPAGYGVGYKDNGDYYLAGAYLGTAASYTVGDVIKMVKAGAIITIYKQTGGSGAFVLQATIDATGYPVAGSVYATASTNQFFVGQKFTLTVQ